MIGLLAGPKVWLAAGTTDIIFAREGVDLDRALLLWNC